MGTPINSLRRHHASWFFSLFLYYFKFVFHSTGSAWKYSKNFNSSSFVQVTLILTPRGTQYTTVQVGGSRATEKHANVESIHVLACSHILALLCLAPKNRQKVEKSRRTTRELEKNTRIASTFTFLACFSRSREILVRMWSALYTHVCERL